MRTDTVEIPVIGGRCPAPARRRVLPVLGLLAFLLLLVAVAYSGVVVADLTGLSR